MWSWQLEMTRARSGDVFNRGQFDELELLRVAREYDAQAILFGKVTQYYPYTPPKIGLSLIMISPAEGVAIASADGLWDARAIDGSPGLGVFPSGHQLEAKSVGNRPGSGIARRVPAICLFADRVVAACGRNEDSGRSNRNDHADGWVRSANRSACPPADAAQCIPAGPSPYYELPPNPH